MKKNDKRQLDDNFIEQKIADAFGYTDEKLAAELDRFMAEAASERGQRPPEAPEEEFRKILDIVERENDSGCGSVGEYGAWRRYVGWG